MGTIVKVKAGGTEHLVGSALYGTCNTAFGTAAKVVVCSNFDTLISGITIHVYMATDNTADNPTLNVNNTGAKIIKPNAVRPNWRPGEVVSFTYDGTYWVMNSTVASVGGRNLLKNSDQTMTKSTTATTESFLYGSLADSPLEYGTTYTLSADVRVNDYVSSVYFFCYNTKVDWATSRVFTPSVSDDFVRLHWTFTTLTDTSKGAPTIIRFDNNGSKTSGQTATLEIRRPKLELGNVPTDWSAAPEDFYTSYTTTSVGSASSWSSGSMTSTSYSGGVLAINTGTTPSLTITSTNVINGLS